MQDIEKIRKGIEKTKNEILKVLLSAGYLTGIVLIVIGLVLIFIEISTFYKIYEIDSWPILKGAGTIIETYIESKSDIDGYGGFILSNYTKALLYRTRIAFSYVVNGVQSISYKYSYHEPWYANPTITAHETDVLTKGSTVDVIINPTNPQEAYIANRKYTHLDSTAIGLAVLLSGLYITYYSK
jgi:hypothetical protein